MIIGGVSTEAGVDVVDIDGQDGPVRVLAAVHAPLLERLTFSPSTVNFWRCVTIVGALISHNALIE